MSIAKRQRRLRVLLIAAVTVLAALSPIGAAAANSSTKAGGGGLTGASPLALPPSSAVVEASHSPLKVPDSCGAVKTQLSSLAAHGIASASCVGPDTRPAAAQSTFAAAAPSWCNLGNWYYYRFEACGKFDDSLKIFDPKTGATLGDVYFTITQDIVLNSSQRIFTEDDTVAFTSSDGTVPPGLTVTWNAACGGNCAVESTTFPNAAAVVVGSSVSGTVTYSDFTSTVDTTQSSYTMEFSNATASSTPITWQSVQYRCDNQVSANPGCVVPAYAPHFSLSVATYGAAAMTYWWAQISLPDQWGYSGATRAGGPQPLTRLADSSQQSLNRNAVCPTSGPYQMVPDPTVTNDSCDEFAFAATNQSARMLTPSLSAPDCAEITVYQSNGQWYYTAHNTITGSQRCVRGHVPQNLNTAAGGQLGIFTSQQRLLDQDAYWLDIVA